jgi:hypothetical protein
VEAVSSIGKLRTHRDVVIGYNLRGTVHFSFVRNKNFWDEFMTVYVK